MRERIISPLLVPQFAGLFGSDAQLQFTLLTEPLVQKRSPGAGLPGGSIRTGASRCKGPMMTFPTARGLGEKPPTIHP
ncbi:hypothetical protein C5E02_09695 [Rathayibacter rathayi]|uniref:Uncharacterized protein n=1 Tax=Rathayibacter rathayi TaxID=33887 RepID=A0ABD6W691_RATRA|nr:hypothetical protein C1O28_09990 [Rathayibacter rathayi]PPF11724.1 hypothetical protein C5C04_11600 [Rathayibacter rathayi]PPF47810.1 hypothetical protein C5C08_10520 [Rathayibacter rathayi]PPG12128.1 hypothetical protein C5C11_10350 [Rathayibacter rathayi]PPG67012.1 hypothetical protein C5C16_10165 [Rathayibacter rathayi]